MPSTHVVVPTTTVEPVLVADVDLELDKAFRVRGPLLSVNEPDSYYQIVVNPAGALVELDRGAPRNQWFNWSSKAEVATRIADDHWTMEIRIPVTQDENDPLNQVVGRKPTQSLPWFVNVCRQRIRNSGSEFSAPQPDRFMRDDDAAFSQ